MTRTGSVAASVRLTFGRLVAYSTNQLPLNMAALPVVLNVSHFYGEVLKVLPPLTITQEELEGGIRIDTHGRSTSYGPGGAWYETGPDPVFAQAAADRPSRFIRVMILPRALLGKSSIEYLDEADRAKPRSQQYKVFVDAPIAVAPVRP